MFPLLENSIIGYRFGQKTHYNNFHIGLDLKAFYVDLFAPFDGTVTTSLGKQGGKTITFKPDNQDIVIRFLHLDEFIKTGHVKQGERIAITGNSGLSSNPHLHLDISKHAVDLNNINNFIDPEKFNWEQSMKRTVQVIFNNQKWNSEVLAINELKAKMFERSSGRIELEFLPSIYTNFTNFPFLVYLAGGVGVSAIKEEWYNQNISPLSKADITLFVVNKKDYKTSFDNRTTYGYTYFKLGGKFPIECQIMCEEGDMSFKYPSLNAFSDYAIHEISHGLYQLGDASNYDRTHVHYLSGQDGISKAFNDFDYDLIKSKLKGKPMNQAKVVKSKNSPTVYVVYPMPSMDYLNAKANLEGFEVPVSIPDTDSL